MTIHFILPGYAPHAVGGYRVVYDYALAITTSQEAEVIVHHSPWPLLRHISTLRPRAVAGLFMRTLRSWLDRPRERGVPWYAGTTALDMRFSFGPPRITIQPGDIVVATSAHTAPFVYKHYRGATQAYFIQHVEKWSASEGYVAATWRLPLRKIVIAPWLQEYGQSLGVESELVRNAIDGSVFAKAAPLRERPQQVIAMMSPLHFKRADVIVDVFRRLHEADPAIVLLAFGAQNRPKSLPTYVEYVQNPTRSRLSHMYSSSRVYLCASDAEGWHLPPGEALMCGTAVASTDIGGVRVVAGDDALYAIPGDGAGLADCVLKLLTQPELAQDLVDRGEARLRRYSPTAAASAFYAALIAAQGEDSANHGQP